MSGVEPPGTFQSSSEGGGGALELLDLLEGEEVIKHFNRRISSAVDFCVERWNVAAENNRFVSPEAGSQWDRADYNKRVKSGRFAWTINDIALAVHALSGQEITGRFQRTFRGRTDDVDHLVAEAINTADQRIREEALAEHIESDGFRTLGIEGYSWLEWYQDHLEDYRGKTMVRHHELWDTMWDSTARRSMLLDREWDAAGWWISLDNFLALFPSKREDLLQYLRRPEGWVREGELGEVARWPWLYRATRGRYVNPQRREVFLVDYQWRQREPLWVVEMPGAPDPETGAPGPATWEEFGDEGEFKEAVDKFAFDNDGVEPHYAGPEDGLYRWRYHRAHLVGDKLLREAPIPERQFTRICMTGFPHRQMDRVTFHGVVDYMKDPQKFKNAIISMMTSMLQRSLKGGMIYDPKGFDRPDELADQMAQPYPMVATKPGAMIQGQKVWEQIPVSTFPSGLDSFLSMADMAVWRPVGLNPDVLGQIKDMRRVSGVVFSSVSEAGSVVLGYLFNSLKLYRQLSGKLMLAILRSAPGYDQQRLQEMVGDSHAGYIPPKEEWERFFDRDVVVDEQAATTKDKRMELWDLLSRQGTGEKLVTSGLMPPKHLARLMPGITEVERQEWISWLDQRSDLEAEQQRLQMLQTQLQIMQIEMQMQQMQVGAGQPEEGGAAPEEGQPQQ